MPLMSAIILDAYRESNLVAEEATLTATQENTGLERLTSLIAGVYGYDAGERLCDWPVGSANWQESDVRGWSELDWKYPIANSRLILNLTSPQTIYLPPTPTDGARIGLVDAGGTLNAQPLTLVGNGRLIEDATSVTVSTNGLVKEWMYRADLANWQAITALDLTDQLPFPAEFDDYFIIKLAARLNPRYGRSLNDLSIMRLNDMREQLSSRYRQERPVSVPTALVNLRGPSDHRYDANANGRAGRFGWMR